jgi:hypothetical protein
LRCEVREKLLAFLQTECPDCLPRQRVEMPQAVELLQQGNGRDRAADLRH